MGGPVAGSLKYRGTPRCVGGTQRGRGFSARSSTGDRPDLGLRALPAQGAGGLQFGVCLAPGAIRLAGFFRQSHG